MLRCSKVTVASLVVLTSGGISEAAVTIDCSHESKAAEIDRAIDRVQTILGVADAFIGPSDPIYKEWFGDYSEGLNGDGGSVVGSIFADIALMLNAEYDLVIHCSDQLCPSDNSACWFERYSDSGNINFMDKWFALDTVAFEADGNKTGILVHELSHLADDYTFDIGIDDGVTYCQENALKICYGTANARELAVNDPDLAVYNGENYEHFASHVHLMTMLPPILHLMQ